jgi:hypothetical protein
MDTQSLRELLLVFGGPLKHQFPVDTAVPLDIKLRLERLRLEELLREARQQSMSGYDRKAGGHG